MFNIVCVISLSFACGLSAPVDEPIRIDLPVYEQPQVNSNISVTRLTEPFESKSTTNLLESEPETSSKDIGNIFSPPVTSLDRAVLETEGWGSRKLSIKENVQSAVAGLFQPKPIVDTIKEEEKYGNDGDKFYKVGRAIVSSAEGVSNFVSNVLEVPSSLFRNISRTTSEKLNNLGGRLIGL